MKFYDAEVVEIIKESPTVNRYFLKIDTPEYNFLPGQFAILELPIKDTYNTRSYSIASAPGDEFLELCIVYKKGGAATEFIFEHVQTGSWLKVSEPQGKFLLSETESEALCFICTGTGVAPFRSMILHQRKQAGFKKKVFLIFGNRTEADILYREEFETMATDDPNFVFLPVLSKPGSNWTGAKGYVHPLYQEIATKYPFADFYICGWTEMVREAKNNLKARGFTRKQLKFELYD